MTDFADSPVPYDNRAGAAVYTPADTTTARILDARLADASVLLGALSVVTFWSFGVGILLGLGAVVAGGLATRVPDADRSDTIIGILTGAVGIAVGALFLSAT